MAQWIWYPGDFEMMLGLRMWSTRTERGTQITPNWKVETFYPNVKFRKTFDLPEDTVVHIHAHGGLAVQVDRKWYTHEFRNGLKMKKGRHSLLLTVFNDKELPAVYIDHSRAFTDNTWEASSAEGEWVPAECWNFTDVAAPPSTFRLATEPVHPVVVQRRDGGTLYDFGRELMAFLRLHGVKGQGVQPVAYGESEAEALDLKGCELYDELTLSGDYTTDNTRAFRYVFLPETADVQVERVDALYEYLPLENRGAFRCPDQRLNAIYDTSVYTLHLNSREFFLDGIKRDRWVWSGDATQSYLLNFYSFFDSDLCKRTMRLLRGKDPIRTHLNTIQDYTCYWFISLYDYYMYTGDKEFLIRMYDNAKGLMDYCLALMDERGFFMSRPKDWVFIDWAPMKKRGDVSVIQILFARALETMALIAGLCRKGKEARFYREAYRKTLGNVMAYFWSEEKGCFTHGPAADPDAKVTRYANMFALLFGYVKGRKRKSLIRAALLNDDVQAITTPYMKYYELLALCEAGDMTRVLDYIRDYWGGMLDLGATTFWEKYIPHQRGVAHYAMYNRPYGKSLCHAWGAGPIVLLGKYVLGVRPTGAGYTTFAVEPQPGDLPSLEGKVPTPTGDITVRYDGKGVTVVNDTDGEGTLRWCGNVWTVAPHSTVKTNDV